jgi:eukaryotic-like serine/threonine-protein kinase
VNTTLRETPWTAETLDAPASLSSSMPLTSPRQNVALVEGSAPHLTEETQDLLRNRLRISALILFAGYLCLFLRDLFALANYTTRADWVQFCAHVLITLLMGGIGLGLCRRCAVSLHRLRIAELLIFGGSALFFVISQYTVCDHCAEMGHIPRMMPPWLLLMFTYALFVPNPWRRAAVAIGAMAAAPVMLALYLSLTNPGFHAVIKSSPEIYGNFVLGMGMFMALGFFAATFGVHTIGSLRYEVHQAKQLGQYRLKEQLGSGGMGEVFLAEHQLLKRPCAIKIIHPEKAGDARVLARFEREVRATAKLSHWNTVEIFDYGRSNDGTFYYVMEYLPGLTLAQIVARHGPMPADRVVHLITQTCDALAEAHANGLIHRDIKPANIFAAYRGGVHDVAKLLDFGLVKPLTNGRSVSLTQEGAITGSPLFMSPEQVTGEIGPDPRSDIYSLGTVIYFTLTGQPPFRGEKPLQVMIAHAHDDVLPPTQIRPEIPEDLELVVLRCLAKRPEDRYQTAAQLRDALADCDVAGRWTAASADHWWREFGCPEKRALDKAILEAAGM